MILGIEAIGEAISAEWGDLVVPGGAIGAILFTFRWLLTRADGLMSDNIRIIQQQRDTAVAEREEERRLRAEEKRKHAEEMQAAASRIDRLENDLMVCRIKHGGLDPGDVQDGGQ